jgi:hypothetical protein
MAGNIMAPGINGEVFEDINKAYLLEVTSGLVKEAYPPVVTICNIEAVLAVEPDDRDILKFIRPLSLFADGQKELPRWVVFLNPCPV